MTHTNTCQPSRFYRDSPDFDFQNLQKSGHPYFQEFRPVNIPVFKVIFKDINHYFQGLVFANREEIKISFIDLNRMYDWLVNFGAECSARSICFDLPLLPVLVCGAGGGGGGVVLEQ